MARPGSADCLLISKQPEIGPGQTKLQKRSYTPRLSAQTRNLHTNYLMPEHTSINSNSTRPRVTVFIPVYNTEKYIAEAIQSILNQTFTDFELLVIDDGSTDRTVEVIRNFSDDPRLRLVVQEKNQGRPKTRNHGLELARGEYLALLDADDYSPPDRLEKQVSFLDAHPDIDVMSGRVDAIDEQGNVIKRNRKKKTRLPEVVACRILTDCPLLQNTMMFRMASLSTYRYDEDFLVAQDYELWSRMIPDCRFIITPDTFASYRKHPAQAGQAQAHHQAEARQKIYGNLIKSLDLSFDEDDLIRHEWLFKRRKPHNADFPLDIEYLKWARNWLERLLESNAKYDKYPEPEFSHMLANRWLHILKKSAPKHALTAWQLSRKTTLHSAVTAYRWHKFKSVLKLQ